MMRQNACLQPKASAHDRTLTIAEKKGGRRAISGVGIRLFLGLLTLELLTGTLSLRIAEAEPPFPLCTDECKDPEPFKEPTTRCDVACTIRERSGGYIEYIATTCGAAGFPCSGWGEPTPEGGGEGGGGGEGEGGSGEDPQPGTGRTQDTYSRAGVEFRIASTFGRAVLSGGHVGCNYPGFCTSGVWDGVPGSSWIWSSAQVTPYEAERGSSVSFYERMCLSAAPEELSFHDPSLEIAADNVYEVYYVDADKRRTTGILAQGCDNFRSGQSTHHLLPLLAEQCQTIEISVHNVGVPGSTPYTNPAGVSYHLHIWALY
jgi:hypothetical protein